MSCLKASRQKKRIMWNFLFLFVKFLLGALVRILTLKIVKSRFTVEKIPFNYLLGSQINRQEALLHKSVVCSFRQLVEMKIFLKWWLLGTHSVGKSYLTFNPTIQLKLVGLIFYEIRIMFRLLSAFRDKFEKCTTDFDCTKQKDWYFHRQGMGFVRKYRKLAINKFGTEFFSEKYVQISIINRHLLP